VVKSSDEERCPFCKKPVATTAERCPSCGEALFEEEDERVTADPDRKRQPRREARDEEEEEWMSAERGRSRPPRRERRYEDEEEDPIERRIRRHDTTEATDFLIPTNVSGWSLAACYCGLIGFCLPLLGLPFALTGVVCGIVALRRRRKAASYGAVTSDIRAVLGLILGGLGVLVWGGSALWWAIVGK
jgi:hypothetical protein